MCTTKDKNKLTFSAPNLAKTIKKRKKRNRKALEIAKGK